MDGLGGYRKIGRRTAPGWKITVLVKLWSNYLNKLKIRLNRFRWHSLLFFSFHLMKRVIQYWLFLPSVATKSNNALQRRTAAWIEIQRSVCSVYTDDTYKQIRIVCIQPSCARLAFFARTVNMYSKFSPRHSLFLEFILHFVCLQKVIISEWWHRLRGWVVGCVCGTRDVREQGTGSGGR